MKKLTLLFLVIALSTSGLLAQVKIQGKVTDAQGLPLPGVSVTEKGTAKGTATNANGLFSLEVSSKTALIKFFRLGFQTQELTIPESNEFTVMLKEKAPEACVAVPPKLRFRLT